MANSIHVEKGALHAELGLPQGEKIGKARLEAAKARGEREHNPKLVKRATFALNFNHAGHHGTVEKVEMHHDGKHAVIHVRHGAKPKKAKGENFNSFDDRPMSQAMVPVKEASNYHVGQKVGVGVAPLNDGMDADNDTSEPDHDPDDGNAEYRQMQRRIMSPRRGK